MIILITKYISSENGMIMPLVKSGYDEDLSRVPLHIHHEWFTHLEITHHRHQRNGRQPLLSHQEYLPGKTSCQPGHPLIMK